ncbi:MAG: DUF1015 domain-containing protein [Gemmatimonadales bacterium]
MTETPLFTAFRGEHFAEAASLSKRLAPPYDVLNPAQRAALAALDPANIVHADLPLAANGGDPYPVAAELLRAWRAAGTLVRDAGPSAYVLRTTAALPDGSVRVRTGVFLALSAEPFATGRVLPHEKTHAGPKEDRRRLMHATGTNLSPVFVLAPDEAGTLEGLLKEVERTTPWARCEAIGATHEVWIVGGARAERLAQAAGAAPVYIADGHHRFETSVLFRGEAPEAWKAGAARTLAHVVSFRDPGLAILPTHRIVQGAPLSREAFLAAAQPFFTVPTDAADATLTVLFADCAEVPLRLRPDADLSRVRDLAAHPAVRELAVAIADAVAIRTVAATLMRGAPALGYTADAEEARAAACGAECAFAVLLPPTRIEQVRRVADAGQVMPQKSTFFAPKIPTGVVIRAFDGEG